MKKKLLIILFLAYLVMPSFIYYIFFHNNDVTSENRNLAEFPTFTNSVSKYTSELENYYNDHAPFRKELIHIKNTIDMKLFNDLDLSSNVIFGKDGWFFYKGGLKQYIRAETYTEEELNQIYDKIYPKIKLFEEKGIKIAIIVCTNKEEIYPEYMNDRYKVNDREIATEQLVHFLKNKGINIISTRDTLLNNKNTGYLYYKNDTHWNLKGAYFGAKLLLESLNIHIEDVTFKETMTYDGDITLMTGITNLRNEDFYYSPIFSQKMNISQKELGTFTYYQNDQAKEGKLYLIGDSFNDLLKDYLVRYFHETYKIHKDDEANYAFDIKTGDTIVFETVERYIDTLDDSIINFNMGGA